MLFKVSETLATHSLANFFYHIVGKFLGTSFLFFSLPQRCFLVYIVNIRYLLFSNFVSQNAFILSLLQNVGLTEVSMSHRDCNLYRLAVRACVYFLSRLTSTYTHINYECCLYQTQYYINVSIMCNYITALYW